MRELLSQVELLEAACRRALESNCNPAARKDAVAALDGFTLSSQELRRIARPYVTGLANMVRAHADGLRHSLETAPDGPVGQGLLHAALEQVCGSLADLREALIHLERSGDQ